MHIGTCFTMADCDDELAFDASLLDYLGDAMMDSLVSPDDVAAGMFSAVESLLGNLDDQMSVDAIHPDAEDIDQGLEAIAADSIADLLAHELSHSHNDPSAADAHVEPPDAKRKKTARGGYRHGTRGGQCKPPGAIETSDTCC